MVPWKTRRITLLRLAHGLQCHLWSSDSAWGWPGQKRVCRKGRLVRIAKTEVTLALLAGASLSVLWNRLRSSLGDGLISILPWFLFWCCQQNIEMLLPAASRKQIREFLAGLDFPHRLLEDWSVFYTLVFMRSKPSAINSTFGRHPYHLGRGLFQYMNWVTSLRPWVRIGTKCHLFTAASGLILASEPFGHFL